MKPDLLIQNLYDNVLFNPIFVHPELNKLLIVSGYASAAMGFHHLDDFRQHEKAPRIELIYGMVKTDGISKSNHEGFQNLEKSNFPGQFTCAYLGKGEPVHAKIYIWCHDDTPRFAFTGSANYTQTALLNSQRREVLEECRTARAYDFFKSLRADTIDCCDPDVGKTLDVAVNWSHYGAQGNVVLRTSADSPVKIVQDKSSQFFGLERASISLVDKSGTVPTRSGLNWGQRPELHRDANQAYLSVRGQLRKMNFFPAVGRYFTVLTDDNQIIQCSRAQADGKGIHTPHDNAEIGRYFRHRLGVPEGGVVTIQDLQRYGRSTVDFYKLDDENFYMDFSRPKSKT